MWNTTAENAVVWNVKPGVATVGSIALGTSIVVCSIPGLIANTVVMLAIGKGGLLTHPEKTIYKAVFTLLVCDTIQLANVVGIGVASAAQDILVPQWAWRIPGYFFLWNWHESWFLLSFIALNRYVMAVHPGRFLWLSIPRMVNRLMCATWVASLLTVSYSQLLLPCCPYKCREIGRAHV